MDLLVLFSEREKKTRREVNHFELICFLTDGNLSYRLVAKGMQNCMSNCKQGSIRLNLLLKKVGHKTSCCVLRLVDPPAALICGFCANERGPVGQIMFR